MGTGTLIWILAGLLVVFGFFLLPAQGISKIKWLTPKIAFWGLVATILLIGYFLIVLVSSIFA